MKLLRAKSKYLKEIYREMKAEFNKTHDSTDLTISHGTYCVEVNRQIIGICTLARMGYIYNVYVKPEYRKHGYCRQMIKIMTNISFKRERSVIIGCRKKNTAALSIYTKLGFGIFDITDTSYRLIKLRGYYNVAKKEIVEELKEVINGANN